MKRNRILKMFNNSKIMPLWEWFQTFLCHSSGSFVNKHSIVVYPGLSGRCFGPLFLGIFYVMSVVQILTYHCYVTLRKYRLQLIHEWLQFMDTVRARRRR